MAQINPGSGPARPCRINQILHRAAAIFQRDGKPRELIVPTAFANLSLLPADESLRQLPMQLARLGQRRRLANMANFLRSDFNRIVLDCPAGLSEVSDQVIAAADLLIVPLPASPLSARALDMLRRELSGNHHRHPPILPVLSMFDASRAMKRLWTGIENKLAEMNAAERKLHASFSPMKAPAP
ncbi:MAG TPA: ParA family protein [Novosphingobium sp.]|nr:ParA family protein [Novosphingobium sp.]